jgi:hypothetical protein
MRVRLSFIRERLAMDVLDQLLADLRQESCVFCRLNATEPWRIQKSACTVAPFYAVLSGKARIETANNAHDLCEGDFLVLPGGEPHELTGADSASTPPVPLISLLAEAGAEPWRPGVRYRRTVHLQHGGGGPQSVILIGIFSFGDSRKNPLLTIATCACRPCRNGPQYIVVEDDPKRHSGGACGRAARIKSGDSQTRRSALYAVSPRVSGYGPSQFRRLDAWHHGPSCRACHLLHARCTGTPLDIENTCPRGRLFESRFRAAIQRSGRTGSS